MSTPNIPTEFIANMQDKSLVVTPELLEAMPDVVERYQRLDAAYEADPLGYLRSMETHQIQIPHRLGRASITVCQGEGKGLIISGGAFADSEPWSRARTAYLYAEGKTSNKLLAGPNSYRPAMRVAQLAHLTGMTAVGIHNPISSLAYSPRSHAEMPRGNFAAEREIMEAAAAKAQEVVHGSSSETQLTDWHVDGASMGASQMIGGVAEARRREVAELRSLTIREWVVAHSGVFSLLRNFLGSDAVGEPSVLVAGVDYTQAGTISQPILFERMDRNGNEPLWLLRAINGALRLRIRGMTHPEHNKTVTDLAYIVAQGIPTLGVFGENSGMSQGSHAYTPEGMDKSIVRSVSGGRAAHEINEHPVVASVAPLLNITRSRS